MLEGDALRRIEVYDLDRSISGEERIGLEFDDESVAVSLKDFRRLVVVAGKSAPAEVGHHLKHKLTRRLDADCVGPE